MKKKWCRKQRRNGCYQPLATPIGDENLAGLATNFEPGILIMSHENEELYLWSAPVSELVMNIKRKTMPRQCKNSLKVNIANRTFTLTSKITREIGQLREFLKRRTAHSLWFLRWTKRDDENKNQTCFYKRQTKYSRSLRLVS